MTNTAVNMNKNFRTETDTMGALEVPADRYWGAQTQRSLHNFKIGGETMPVPLIRALGVLKYAAAAVNMRLGVLDESIAFSVGGVADRVRDADQHERQRSDRESRD